MTQYTWTRRAATLRVLRASSRSVWVMLWTRHPALSDHLDAATQLVPPLDVKTAPDATMPRLRPPRPRLQPVYAAGRRPWTCAARKAVLAGRRAHARRSRSARLDESPRRHGCSSRGRRPQIQEYSWTRRAATLRVLCASSRSAWVTVWTRRPDRPDNLDPATQVIPPLDVETVPDATTQRQRPSRSRLQPIDAAGRHPRTWQLARPRSLKTPLRARPWTMPSATWTTRARASLACNMSGRLSPPPRLQQPWTTPSNPKKSWTWRARSQGHRGALPDECAYILRGGRGPQSQAGDDRHAMCLRNCAHDEAAAQVCWTRRPRRTPCAAIKTLDHAGRGATTREHHADTLDEAQRRFSAVKISVQPWSRRVARERGRSSIPARGSSRRRRLTHLGPARRTASCATPTSNLHAHGAEL
ncbi:hypothetical protein FA95DRAFT_100062 [Auriscalpium vulgare]|uniref:Uncharacterized protein n=1 Tax=Auriscalpium vulgare TaxID=40419 RepID=A0ACB8R022_9AGAM|nr:hypothetical protein FA95DRAFT_100062 [Auriscalpium vulgare]